MYFNRWKVLGKTGFVLILNPGLEVHRAETSQKPGCCQALGAAKPSGEERDLPAIAMLRELTKLPSDLLGKLLPSRSPVGAT